MTWWLWVLLFIATMCAAAGASIRRVSRQMDEVFNVDMDLGLPSVPCVAAAPVAQLDLIGDVAQPRRSTRENKNVYGAIEFLRKQKFKVERRGPNSHLVNGKAYSDEKLLRLARDAAYGRVVA